MGHIERDRHFEAPASLVWDVVTDPDVYEAVAPNLTRVEVVSGTGEGMVRRCVDTDGNEWTESCRRWDENRSFAVAVDVADSEFHRRLFTRFEGVWTLSEDADGVRVTMAFDFDARYGPLGALLARYLSYRAGPLMTAIFDGWADEIQSRLDASDEPATLVDSSRGEASE